MPRPDPIKMKIRITAGPEETGMSSPVVNKGDVLDAYVRRYADGHYAEIVYLESYYGVVQSWFEIVEGEEDSET